MGSLRDRQLNVAMSTDLCVQSPLIHQLEAGSTGFKADSTATCDTSLNAARPALQLHNHMSHHSLNQVTVVPKAKQTHQPRDALCQVHVVHKPCSRLP